MDREIQNFINGVNRKDAKAWERIYMDYYSPLCHYAMKILNNREQAEDLVQGAIIKLWESPLCFENIAAFNVYLYRTVNNNCLKEIRDKERGRQALERMGFFYG
ncbi:MAG: sigma-70 family RNA polymerase sigma factor [Butyricimonas faecihominis]